MRRHPLPSADYLQACFLYDPRTGILTWRKERPAEHFTTIKRQRIWYSRCAGKATGGNWKHGYKRTRLDDVMYLTHRLIYKMMTGHDPDEVDHKGQNRGDNRWSELRHASRLENSWNSPRGRNTRGLPRGVYPRENGKRYVAYVGDLYLGRFLTVEAAEHARIEHARTLHGQFFYEGQD